MGDDQALHLTRSFSLRYLLALSMIAVLSISANGLVRTILRQQASDAPVINLAGRQRMLSQKLTKEVLLLAQRQRPEERARHRRELETTIAVWSRVHRGLRHGDAELGLPASSSREIDALFTEIDLPYHHLLRSAQEILSLKGEEFAQLTVDFPAVQDIVETSPVYLQWMDRIVFRYDEEAQGRVRRLEQFETYILAAILFLLVLEGLFIFRPMVLQVRRTYRDYQRSNDRLQQEVAERQAAEEQLRRAHDTLELRVEERTLELQAVNARLQQDIVERTRVEEALRESEEHNRVLVQESHHRIKNNLQIISSLLNLQAEDVADETVAAPLRDSRNRIHSMSLIHERLYQSTDLTQIDLAEYLSCFTEDLMHSYTMATGSVALELQLETTVLGFDTAVSCGLIVHELVSNSLKHGFPHGRKGSVCVGLGRSEDARSVVLRVEDDGIGLPPEMTATPGQSLGLQLVSDLVRQLRGTLEFRRGKGTSAEIRFPLRSEDVEGSGSQHCASIA